MPERTDDDEREFGQVQNARMTSISYLVHIILRMTDLTCHLVITHKTHFNKLLTSIVSIQLSSWDCHKFIV